MEQLERVLRLHHLLSNSRFPIPRRQLEEKLDCSQKTVRRDLDFLRDRLGAPIDYDQEKNGWYYRENEQSLYELPGLWLNEEEIHALLSIQQLLSSLDPGLLQDEIAPFESRIKDLLNKSAGIQNEANITQAIRLLTTGKRKRQYQHFQQIASATIQKKQVHITYFGRRKNAVSKRTLSPLRLLHYKENWYLSAWCHKREALRMFSLDKIEQVETLQETVIEQDASEVDHAIHSSFGIFTGLAEERAKLHFNEEAARWVADEVWHPEQQEKCLENGKYELIVPYNHDTELSAEILRFGEDVEVIEPTSLRQLIIQRLSKALSQYQS